MLSPNDRPAQSAWRTLWTRNPIALYTHWLHTQWPAGTVEKLPSAASDGSTNVDGLYIVGDLSGVPLLKLSANAGTEAARLIADQLKGEGDPPDGVLDLAIVGGGTSGFAAAKEAKKLGLRCAVFEASEPFSTIVNFPKGKPIYTYPTDVPVEGDLAFHEKSAVKEGLLDDLLDQTVRDGVPWVRARVEQIDRRGGVLELSIPDQVSTPEGAHLNGTGFIDGQTSVKARRVIVGIGRSGSYRKLDVPGEELDKVYNRLHDPADYADQNVLVVGGGDSAIETAIALADAGATVSLSYRKSEFSRPKPDNQERIDALADEGKVDLLFASNVTEIRDGEVDVKLDETGKTKMLENDSVFTMIGREPPLDFFRKSGVKIRNERTVWWWVTLIGFLLFCTAMYNWKSPHPELPLQNYAREHHAFPYNLDDLVKGTAGKLADWSGREGNLLYTLRKSAGSPSFYYTLAYCTAVVGFGIARIRRRPTPYVKLQTLTLMAVQCIPLFILPEIILPWMGRNGWFSHGGATTWLADHLWERYDQIGHERAYWRSYGFILAFPLNVYNVFTDKPLWLWLGISFVQTCVLIPGMIYFWGKGAYCGWICSCGALAETMGDQQREKMPHGPFWNKLNMLGQAVLAFALVLLGLRIIAWIAGPESWAGRGFTALFEGIPFLNYAWGVDILLAGILGYGLYFWFSGRTWCRFACPLAALMHIYARFSRFAIIPEKKKCISCNVCTSVCHQGIDVMSFANKGRPMQDPECVRCSACVQMCPTGVLSFGQVDGGGAVLSHDPAWLAASPVRMREMHQVTVNGKVVK